MADYMLSRIRLAVSDPLGLLGGIAGVALDCRSQVPLSNTATQACTWFKNVATFNDVLQSIRTFRNFNFQKEVDVCSLLKKE